METQLEEIMTSDMEANLDQSQYGSRKGLSINYYLIQVIHRTLTVLDKNSKTNIFAVIANMVD